MPKKRSRLGQSGSFVEIGMLNQIPPPDLRLDSTLRANFTDHSHPSILKVSSPSLTCETAFRDLERCYQCNERLGQSDDIYMYSDAAFCTQECRSIRIAIDKVAEEMGKKKSGGGMLK